MDTKHSQEASRAQVEKRGVGAKQGGIAELEQRPQDGGGGGDARVGDAELVEVVDVGEAEDERGEEDGFGEGGTREDHEWDGGGPKKNFFG